MPSGGTPTRTPSGRVHEAHFAREVRETDEVLRVLDDRGEEVAVRFGAFPLREVADDADEYSLVARRDCAEREPEREHAAVGPACDDLERPATAGRRPGEHADDPRVVAAIGAARQEPRDARPARVRGREPEHPHGGRVDRCDPAAGVDGEDALRGMIEHGAHACLARVGRAPRDDGPAAFVASFRPFATHARRRPDREEKERCGDERPEGAQAHHDRVDRAHDVASIDVHEQRPTWCVRGAHASLHPGVAGQDGRAPARIGFLEITGNRRGARERGRQRELSEGGAAAGAGDQVAVRAHQVPRDRGIMAPRATEVARAAVEDVLHAREARARDERAAERSRRVDEGDRESQQRAGTARVGRADRTDVETGVARDREPGGRRDGVATASDLGRRDDATAGIGHRDPSKFRMLRREGRQVLGGRARVVLGQRGAESAESAHVVGQDQVECVDALGRGERERLPGARDQMVTQAREPDVADRDPGERRRADQRGEPRVRSRRAFRERHRVRSIRRDVGVPVRADVTRVRCNPRARRTPGEMARTPGAKRRGCEPPIDRRIRASRNDGTHCGVFRDRRNDDALQT